MSRGRRIGVACLAIAATVLTSAATIANASAAGRTPSDTTAPCGGEVVLKPDGSPWQCSFDDEFDAAGLNTTNWVPQLTSNSQYTTGPAGSQACYVDSPDTISVSAGVLSLTARKQAPFTCSTGVGSFTTQYTAGMVTSVSKFSQSYGRFEVRAKLPQTAVKGLQETFWLYPTDQNLYGPWPQSGEIDFAEMYSVMAYRDIPYIHYAYDPSTVNAQTNTNIVTAACSITLSSFNTYAVVWEPGTITIYTNGRVCLTDNYAASGLTSPAPFDQNFFIALTQALGVTTNAFTPGKTKIPATTQIDYVRAWS